jgi:lauroyl/myristoyl acyltransferase
MEFAKAGRPGCLRPVRRKVSIMDWDVQGWFSGELGVRLAGLLGRTLPPRLGYALADFIADRIAASRNAGMVRAVRANQWVAGGEALEGKALDRAVRETFRHSARSIYDLHRGIQHPRKTQESIVMDAGARFLFRRPEFDKRGLVMASLHLGSFDLLLHMLCMGGMKPLVLTIPDPRGAHRMEFESRKKAGVNLLPASVGAIRKALRHLQRGGLVATGIDRPIPRPKIRPRFFGRPAALPLHYIFLALQADVPLMMMTTIRGPGGTHFVSTSPMMEMEPHPDREIEAQRNAEKVLRVAEEIIRKTPTQWTVPLPVWPEVLDRIPG